MKNEFALGFVAIFEKALDKARIEKIAASWLERFEKVEQVAARDIATLPIETLEDICWENNLQFRVTEGGEFSWIYLTLQSKVIETTGQPNGDQVSLCLTVLTELPELITIIPDSDQKRLDEFESQGYF